MIIDNLIKIETIDKNDLLAVPSRVLHDTFVGKAGIIETGTMPDNGAVTKTLAAGESYAVSLGYHNGSGVVSAKTLAEQTTATAGATQILSPYTAWVTGGKITGTMVNRTGWTSSVAMNGSVTVPEGYHDGSGKVNGPVITNRGAWTSSVAMNSSVTIPQGYHDGNGKVNGPVIATMGGFTITPTDQTQTFQTTNKYLTGNISCKAASILPPSVVKKGYTYKVGDTTYIGTFEGSADDKYYIFDGTNADTLANIGYGFNANSTHTSSAGWIDMELNISSNKAIVLKTYSNSTSTWGLYSTKSYINLTNRSTLYVKYLTTKNVNKAYFGFSKNGGLTISAAGDNPGLDLQHNLVKESEGTATVNISGLSGNYFFYMFLQSESGNADYSNFQIFNIIAVV